MFQLALAIMSVCCIVSCGGGSQNVIHVEETTGYQPHFGPFDHNGNYVDEWADKPPKRIYVSKDGSSKALAKVSPPPRPQRQIKPAPKPKHTVVKPKKRPPITHIVRRGDTLYGISRRYGSSIKSIQRANRMRGTNLSIGKRLIIPR